MRACHILVGTLLVACTGSNEAVIGSGSSSSSSTSGGTSSSGAASSSGTSGSSSSGANASSSGGSSSGSLPIFDLNTVCDGHAGFTGQSVLDAAAGPYDVLWVPMTTGRPFTSATSVAFKGDAGAKVECIPGGGDGGSRLTLLKVEVVMTVKSLNGALNEIVPTVLSRYYQDPIVGFDGSIAETEKKGTLELSPVPGFTLREVFSGTLGPGATTLAGTVTQRATMGAMTQVKTLGSLQ